MTHSAALPLIGVIVENARMAHWQAQGLRQLESEFRLRYYDCTNMRSPRRQLRHFPYYALNLLSLRSRQTRSQPLPGGADVLRFECEHEGLWQRLPPSLLAQLRADNVVAIIKFGMGLLRVPDDLNVPILSYHHGDPRRFRGRPAGFYELLTGETVVGQIVQRLSNRLDAGSVLAFGEVKALPHSWRKTMAAAYRLSPLLLRPALRHALEGRSLEMHPEGRVTRLPSPLIVARFVMERMAAKARRLAYGALFEKRWEVSTAPLSPASIADLERLPPRKEWTTLPIPNGYSFLADPFFLDDGSVLAEAMSPRTGLGDIVRLHAGEHQRLLTSAHYSYPIPFVHEGRTYLLPETSEHAAPRLFHLVDGRASPGPALRLGAEQRLIDPTPFVHGGRTYLLANRHEDGADVLRLWHGESPTDQLVEHPCSPVCLSPAGGRMAGKVIEAEGRLFRLGQDGRGHYGDGIILFEIERLTPEVYSERPLRLLRCEGRDKGPHTLDLHPGWLLFDHYRERFSAFAGIRRLRALLARR